MGIMMLSQSLRDVAVGNFVGELWPLAGRLPLLFVMFLCCRESRRAEGVWWGEEWGVK